MMHRFAVLFLVAAVAVTRAAITPEDLVKFGKARRECDKSFTLDSSLIERIMQGELVEDRQFFCYAACVVKELGLVKEDGSLNLDLAVSKVPEGLPNHDAIVAAVKECSDKQADDPCDRAQMIFTCLHGKNLPSLIMG